MCASLSHLDIGFHMVYAGTNHHTLHTCMEYPLHIVSVRFTHAVFSTDVGLCVSCSLSFTFFASI